MKFFLSLILLFTGLFNLTAQVNKCFVLVDSAIVLNPSVNGYDIFYRFSDSLRYQGESYAIAFPTNFPLQDTGYFFVTFFGNDQAKIDHVVAILVGNYKSDEPELWIDKNGNLDFSDDGLPQHLEPSEPFVVKLHNERVPQCFHQIKLIRVSALTVDSNFIYKNWGMPGKKESGSIVERVGYWFKDQPMILKQATQVHANPDSTFKIGLIDNNHNGIFNEVGKDIIAISPDKSLQLYRSEWKGARTISETAYIVLNKRNYAVHYVSADGDSICLEPTEHQMPEQLGIGFAFPSLRVISFGVDSISINEEIAKQQFTLLDFWGSWCGGCTMQLPQLKKLHADFPKLKIIGLNKGDSETSGNEYLLKHEIDWANGRLNTEDVTRLRIGAFPTYILVNSEGVVLEISNGVGDIANYLDTFSE